VFVIQAMDWDARVLGLAAGQLLPENDFLVGSDELDVYDLVHVRVPQGQLEQVQKLECLGFRYIGLDVELERTQMVKLNSPTDAAEWRIQHVQHSDTDFEIQGFTIEGSRFMLDARCKERLVTDFWDGVVREHCENFADTVICAVSSPASISQVISKCSWWQSTLMSRTGSWAAYLYRKPHQWQANCRFAYVQMLWQAIPWGSIFT
jgi:hypothetical protein